MRAVKDIKKYAAYMAYASRAKLKAEVTNSYLNWIWWILEPFFNMIVYVFVFGFVFRSEEENFPIYIFIGSTMWNFFSKTMITSTTLIRQKEAVISKVYIPKYILLFVEMFVNGFKFFVSSGLTIFMLIGFRVKVSVNLVWIVPILLVFFMITFGCSAIFMNYGIYINDLAQVIGIALNMMMYLTGIFFSIENRMPEPFSTILGICNPVAFLLTSMRKALMYASSPNISILVIWFLIALLLDGFGIWLIYKNENTYVKIM